MAEPSFLDDERIVFGDLEIFLLHGNDTDRLVARDDVYFMAKSRPYVDGYAQVKAAMSRSVWAAGAQNVLEVGVYRGGSAPFLHRFFEARRLVCIDNRSTVAPLERYREQTGDVLRTHYGIDQGDADSLRRIIEADFTGPIDLVVDDASHFYALSKATFEAVFPYLRPGGAYVLEDWTWSHGADAQAPDHYWWDQPALSTLVFEFLAAYGASNGLIETIGFSPGMMWVTKGWRDVRGGSFQLADHLNLRGRQLSVL
jgi:predicted O-methyltransferase YrrM